tara:strand:- start:13345 stop:13674 length:330 start_codon:yes stop_codon:yes gene_type:complete
MQVTLKNVLDNKDTYSPEVIELATMLDTMSSAYSGYLGDFSRQTYISADALGITDKEATDAIAGIAAVRGALQKEVQKALDTILIGAVVLEAIRLGNVKHEEVVATQKL